MLLCAVVVTIVISLGYKKKLRARADIIVHVLTILTCVKLSEELLKIRHILTDIFEYESNKFSEILRLLRSRNAEVFP